MEDRKKVIFAQGISMQWVKIFSGEQEAHARIAVNHPQLVIIGTMRLCLVNRNDGFYAVQDACTHSGASLSKGTVNYLGEIICPLHNYCFDLQTGRESSSRSADLKSFPVKVDETGFYIGI
jgi:3-phenylpropionate/trans-cinnamate dioxygenase ferredoxin subunit